jgi:hypothetical protein
MLALSQDKQSLVSICNSIIDSCKPFAEDKEMVGSWDKRLPRTGAQWKAVVICLFSWLIDIDFLSWHLEEISRKAKEGPPQLCICKPNTKGAKESATINPNRYSYQKTTNAPHLLAIKYWLSPWQRDI